MNILEREAVHQRAKYLKYKNVNKAFAKKKTPKEETLILDDTLDSDSSSISEAEITLKNMRKPPSPTTQSLLTMKKSATAPSVARETFDSTVADMDLSSIK